MAILELLARDAKVTIKPIAWYAGVYEALTLLGD